MFTKAKLGMIVLLFFLNAMSLSAYSASMSISGTSNPWLAGMPDGTETPYGDHAPENSPVLVSGISIIPHEVLRFSATGSVSNTDIGIGFENPDGGGIQRHTSNSDTAENGIADVTAPLSSLVGVFLNASAPDQTSAPTVLDFTTLASRDFLQFAPELKQIFFIGDGFTSIGDLQTFIVPDGATRLYLGVMDGPGFFNNAGEFLVNVSVVPEPSIYALMGAGLAVLGLVFMRRRQV